MRLPLLLVDNEAIGGAPALVILLGFSEGAQLYVPVGLQRIGDQTMRRVHLHVTVTGAIGLVLGSLDLEAAQAIGLIKTGRNLLLHGKSELERHGGDGLDEQFADRGVDPGSENALAMRIGEEPASPHAYIVCHHDAVATVIIVHIHAAATQAADDPPLQ
jgi:hypothetical protein